MKKTICTILVGFCMFLMGCKDEYSKLNYTVLPKELQDCVVYGLSNSGGGYMKVMRCPNSTTSSTYSDGRTLATTVVIDGVSYQRVDK